MPFLLFKLIFAALFIGLLVVAALIAREVWRKRRLAAPTEPAPAAAKPPRATLGRKRAEPEPATAAGPPPVRRRQLRPLSAVEANDSVPPWADAQPMAAGPQAEPEPATDGGENLSAQVLARLEHAFDEYQHGRITLTEYEALVRAEEAVIACRLATADDSGESPDNALAAQAAVRWCLGWAEEQRRPPAG